MKKKGGAVFDPPPFLRAAAKNHGKRTKRFGFCRVPKRFGDPLEYDMLTRHIIENPIINGKEM
jgi:hypothetical protein